MTTLFLDADLRLSLHPFPQTAVCELALHYQEQTVTAVIPFKYLPTLAHALNAGTSYTALTGAGEGLLLHAHSGRWLVELELRGPGGVVRIGLVPMEAARLAQLLARVA